MCYLETLPSLVSLWEGKRDHAHTHMLGIWLGLHTVVEVEGEEVCVRVHPYVHM